MLDFLEILNWIRDEQFLFWCLWFAGICTVYAVAEAIGNIGIAWRRPHHNTEDVT